MSQDKCQWCGAGELRLGGYACGSIEHEQSLRCKERQWHNETREDLCRERVKVAKLQRRVEELEGLKLGNYETGLSGIWLEVQLPKDSKFDSRLCNTLGDAMPRKEEL